MNVIHCQHGAWPPFQSRASSYATADPIDSLCWKSFPRHFLTIIFIVCVTVEASNFTAGTPCTEGTDTCNRTTQFCNDTQDAPGFVCTCINDTQQLLAQNTCVPIPESQRLYLSTTVYVSAISIDLWKEVNDDNLRKQTILTNFPPSTVTSMKTAAFIGMDAITEGGVGKFALRYSLIFWVNVTSQIKESVAHHVLEMEARKFVTFNQTQIPIIGYTGIFDTKDQMKNNPTNDSIDWCSSPSLFSCRNHSTCFDGGLRYTCPCQVGYYDSNNECYMAVRLAGGQVTLEGRLEYYTEGGWKTVCQQGFTSHNAEVACRQLELPSRGAVYYENAVYGEGTVNISTYRMNCTGRELALSQCAAEPLPPGSCNHTMDVGIRCDPVCVDDYHFGINCSQPCVCNVSNTDLCDRDNGTCYCKAGWEGVTCDDDVDECTQTSACRGALERCQNTEGSFLCLCEAPAERNGEGVCTGVDELATSPLMESSSPIVIIAAVSAGGIALMIITIIVIAVVIKKWRAKTYAQTTTGLSTGSTDYRDLGVSSSYDDGETYDKINDETSSRDLSPLCSTISREGQTIFVKPEEGSDGYCSHLDDDTSETSHGRKESQEAIHGYYRDEEEGPHHGYLHACAATPGPGHGYLHACAATPGPDHGYLHACAATPGPAQSASVADDVSESRSLDDKNAYLHPVYSLYDNNIASVNRTLDMTSDGTDDISSSQSSMDVDESDDNTRKSERGDYLHPIGSVEADGAAGSVNLSSPTVAEGATSGFNQNESPVLLSADVTDTMQEGRITRLSSPRFFALPVHVTTQEDSEAHSQHEDSDTYLHPTGFSSPGLEVTMSPDFSEESVDTRF